MTDLAERIAEIEAAHQNAAVGQWRLSLGAETDDAALAGLRAQEKSRTHADPSRRCRPLLAEREGDNA